MNLYFNNNLIDNYNVFLENLQAIEKEKDERTRLNLVDGILELFYNKTLILWLAEGTDEEKEQGDLLQQLYDKWENSNCCWTDSYAFENIYAIFFQNNVVIKYPFEDYLELVEVKVFKGDQEIHFSYQQLCFNKNFNIDEDLNFEFAFKSKKSIKDTITLNFECSTIKNINFDFSIDLSTDVNKIVVYKKKVNLFNALTDSPSGESAIYLSSNSKILWTQKLQIYEDYIDHEDYIVPISIDNIEIVDANDKQIKVGWDRDIHINKFLNKCDVNLKYKIKVHSNNRMEVKLGFRCEKEPSLNKNYLLRIPKGANNGFATVTKLLKFQRDLSNLEGRFTVGFVGLEDSVYNLCVYGNIYNVNIYNQLKKFVSYCDISKTLTFYQIDNFSPFELTPSSTVGSSSVLTELENYIKNIVPEFCRTESDHSKSSKKTKKGKTASSKAIDNNYAILDALSKDKKNFRVDLPSADELEKISTAFEIPVELETTNYKTSAGIFSSASRDIATIKDGRITNRTMISYSSNIPTTIKSRIVIHVTHHYWDRIEDKRNKESNDSFYSSSTESPWSDSFFDLVVMSPSF